MRELLRIGARVSLTVGAVVFSSALLARQPPVKADDQTQILGLAEVMGSRDCSAIIKAGIPIVDNASAPAIPPMLLAYTYDMVIYCEIQKESFKSALAHAVVGIALEHSSDWLWRTKFELEASLNQFEDAVATIEAMILGRGAALNGVSLQRLYRLDDELIENSLLNLRERLLKVLSQSAFVPDKPGARTDGFRSRYAMILAGQGDRAAAGALINQIEDSQTLIDISLDPGTRALLPPKFDGRAETERELASVQTLVTLRPRALNYVNRAATLLRSLGRYDDSLKVLRSVAAKVGDPTQWDDPDSIVWWWDGLARTLLKLDRFDEAVTAFRQGSTLNELSALNVSQVINLAAAQLEFGRPAETLVTLTAFDDPKRKGSPFGEMQMRVNRGCASFLLGNTNGAQADFDYLVAHEKDAPATLTEMLMCRGNLEGAAGSMIRRLNNVETRVAALRTLSDFNPSRFPRFKNPYTRMLPQLRARPDVQAAISQAGGTRRFGVETTEL